MAFAHPGLQAKVKRIATLWQDPETRVSAEQLAGTVADESLDQLVRLARTDVTALTVLFIKYGPLIGAIVNDVIAPSRGRLREDQAKRKRLRLLASRFTDQDLADAGIDRDSLLEEIRAQFQVLVNGFRPTESGFNWYVSEYLPDRVHTWLRRQVMRREGPKLVPKNHGTRIDLDPDQIKDLGDRRKDEDDFPGIRLLGTESVRRYLLAVLVEVGVVSQAPKNLPTFVELLKRTVEAGYRLDPILIPGAVRSARLLTTGGKLEPGSPHYQQPRGSILPLYVPNDLRLKAFLMSLEGARVLDHARAIYPEDLAWEVLERLYGSGRTVRQAEVVVDLGLTQQRISSLRRVGIRRLLRLVLTAVCRDEQLAPVVVYEKSDLSG